MLSNFECQTNGKWILCGEHAVIRNHPALVFPLKNMPLSLKFNTNNAPLSASLTDHTKSRIDPILLSIVERGFSLLKINPESYFGHFEFSSKLPIGSGLGASAALSVAISKWFIAQNFIEENDCYTFSRELENLFHSKSSGLDIAGSMCDHGVYFQQGNIRSLNLSWAPKWFLSFSGTVGNTASCVKKVAKLLITSPKHSLELDQQMAKSVNIAEQALTQIYTKNSILDLAKAINLASNCFTQWQLMNDDVNNHISKLQNAGAIATKPTGSGDGGYVLSLWQDKPPESLSDILVEI